MPMSCGPGNVRCLVAVVLASAVASAPLRAQQTPLSPLSSIRVTGDAKVTAKPDRVQIDIGVTTRAAQSQEAASQNARQVDAVLAAMRKATPAAVLKTISYSLNPTYQYHSNGEEPTITGYSAVNVVQVTLDDLAKIGTVIDSATLTGANHVQGIQFTLRDQDAVRAEALRQAATRARAEADMLAAALGLKVVRVLSVEENSPRLVPVRAYMGAPRAVVSTAMATPVEAGTLDVTADVVLTGEVSPTARQAQIRGKWHDHGASVARSQGSGSVFSRARGSGAGGDPRHGRPSRRRAAGHERRSARRHRVRARLRPQGDPARALLERHSGARHHDFPGAHRVGRHLGAAVHAACHRQARAAPAGGRGGPRRRH